ncbi:sigma-70 family RNA polymerase sigma factor [Paenibacillus sp. SI8]|uniref:sigma-70 family RNA polymerase sigma factor n=1 Tax=unclassified Paenibacillus TaxID=185978 RepID=UPI003465B78F
MDSEKERELVARARRGDVDAYSVLLGKYSNAVYATALSMIRDYHLAQDIAQEAFVKAWFKLGTLEQQEHFGGWLFMITKRLCVDWLRKERPAEPIDTYANLTDRADGVEAIVERRLVQQTIWDAVNQLDEAKRLVTILYYISGFTAREISQYLSLSISAVESRIKRSKEQLKKELLSYMAQELESNKVGKQFEEDVLWKIVPRISTIEIPVGDMTRAIHWYGQILGTKVVYQDGLTAMLHLQGGNRIGVPTLYLVQTDDPQRLSFFNTNTNIIHSVIDFFVPDLERFRFFLIDQGVEVTGINYIPGLEGMGGFGFKDPEGNSLSVCNVTHQGQVSP